MANYDFEKLICHFVHYSFPPIHFINPERLKIKLVNSIIIINISITYLGLAKPAQKKNANLPNSGGCMVIKPEVDDGATGGLFMDRLIEATDSMAKR